MLRSEMIPFDYAYQLDNGQFGVTPDGVGVYWYDTYEDVIEDFGPLPIVAVRRIED